MQRIDKYSLRHQFKRQLAISIGVLVVLFSYLLYHLFFVGINSTMHRTMMSMAQHYGEQLAQNEHYQLPRGRSYSAYVGQQNIPEPIKAAFDLDKISNFKLMIYDASPWLSLSQPESVYFLFAYPLRHSNERLYLIYHERPKKHLPAHDRPPLARGPILNVPVSILMVTLIAIALVYWVARSLINKVLDPLHKLTKMAESLDENNPEPSFEVMKDKTEIGMVANTLHQTMTRIHQYHQREKQFLQNASHELRTPIAIVSSALDIIELRSKRGNPQLEDQHTNIRRANRNMADITEALLLLSRNDSEKAKRETVDLAQLVTAVIDEHKYLLDGKDVNVELTTGNCIQLALPKSLCRITLSNLIRNAFEHSLKGSVAVQLHNKTVSISNSSAGLASDAQYCAKRGSSSGHGFGIGLDIVKQIVEQQSWLLDIYYDQEDSFNVIVSF